MGYIWLGFLGADNFKCRHPVSYHIPFISVQWFWKLNTLMGMTSLLFIYEPHQRTHTQVDVRETWRLNRSNTKGQSTGRYRNRTFAVTKIWLGIIRLSRAVLTSFISTHTAYIRTHTAYISSHPAYICYVDNRIEPHLLLRVLQPFHLDSEELHTSSLQNRFVARMQCWCFTEFKQIGNWESTVTW
jgi:hypothetical protein